MIIPPAHNPRQPRRTSGTFHLLMWTAGRCPHCNELPDLYKEGEDWVIHCKDPKCPIPKCRGSFVTRVAEAWRMERLTRYPAVEEPEPEMEAPSVERPLSRDEILKDLSAPLCPKKP